ncbi:sulfatase-like hydrolase/transferase [Phyllobacterium phragmitis]|nr:sulfatase-like hydrolase/transferase [Phyllobacterium phragmitis]
MGERPNIVMFMTDQHAARILGCAGDRSAETPNLDRLAAQGTRFENCYCPSPLCVPSRTAFLTGLEPHQSGVLTNDDYLASDIPTIAHAMAAAGYECGLIGRMHFYGPDQLHGFGSRPIGDIGASYPGANPPDIGDLTKGRGNRGPELEFSGAGETSYQAYDAAVASHAEEALKRVAEQRSSSAKPFFLLISFFCPHPPYIAPDEDYTAFEGKVPPPTLSEPADEHPALQEWRAAGGMRGVSRSATRRSRTAYYGLVRMIDRLIGRLLDQMDDLGLSDAVTIYASDHGECLGERGLWWKSVMYDASAKVPLIIRAPFATPGSLDHRVCNLIDLSATLLELAETPGLPGHKGHSLISPENQHLRTFSSYYGGLMNIKLPLHQHRMIRSGSYKLTHYGGGAPTLFNLQSDPHELDDLADNPDYANIRNDLERLLMDGWDAEKIKAMQEMSAARNAVIRRWVKATDPSEPARWFDPHPERNRYRESQSI